ncbi:T9SS type A sorting domain-containing protein [Puia sp. P3]|uniref:T9SS type A sorting domain-containing protein n=1 Tax=Puia sp. P3 TaxID=3423952 RepID=UPI003D664100
MYADSLKVVAPDTTATISLKGNSLPPASTMSIVSWNLDYFGSPEWGAGPIDKSSQTAAIGAILPSLHADVYALQEVVNESSLQAIVASMPGYAYSISTYGSHSNPSDPTPATLDTVQKLAFVYDTVKVKNIQLNSLLTTGTRLPADVATRYYSDWTNGRYPYMLTASVTLDNRNGDTIVRKIRFINIHATVGNQLTAYNSRWRGAFALDSLIQSNYKNDNVIVLGDYNDDLNRSVTSGKDTSSYMPFIRDSQLYQFPTRTLDLQNENSEINKTGVLENMLLNNSTAAWYLPFSATVLSEVSSGNSSFGSTVTSHYPVVTQLSFAPPIVPLPVTLLNFNAVKHGTGAKVSWTTTQETNSDHFDVQRSGDNRNFTTIATVAAQGNRQTATDYRCTDVSPLMGDNYYRLRPVDKDGHSTLSKTVLLDFNSMTVRLSPNPAHGTVNLFFGKTSEPLFIQIVDGSGQVVSQFRSTGGTTSYLIDVSQYPKGVYVVKVTGAATTVTQKLLVQ